MLSLDDIKNASFRRASFGGYKPEDVDNFIDNVEQSYDKLLSERSSYIKEIEELKKIVNKYREEEGSIRNAILAAQKLADASIKDAKDKAERIINDAKLDVEKEKVASQEIYTEIDKFKNNILGLYEEHIKLIKSIPSKANLANKCENLLETTNDVENKVCINNTDLNVKVETKNLNHVDKDFTCDDDNCIDSGRIVEPEVNKKKFENLKFGSDYNVKSESESSPRVGLFKRRR